MNPQNLFGKIFRLPGALDFSLSLPLITSETLPCALVLESPPRVPCLTLCLSHLEKYSSRCSTEPILSSMYPDLWRRLGKEPSQLRPGHFSSHVFCYAYRNFVAWSLSILLTHLKEVSDGHNPAQKSCHRSCRLRWAAQGHTAAVAASDCLQN